MPTSYTLVCDDERAREVERLAVENDLTEEAVLRQLVDIVLESLEDQRVSRP
jgi:hypothetical protein